MNNLDQLTSIIVTYRTNHDILLDCLNSIHKDVKILIVENSNDAGFKQKFESKFKNVSVILSGKNLGYGGGNNLGIKNSKTNFVFISNPDVIYEKNFFLEIDSYMENKIDFTIMGVSYRDDKHLPYGSFGNKRNKILKEFVLLCICVWGLCMHVSFIILKCCIVLKLCVLLLSIYLHLQV